MAKSTHSMFKNLPTSKVLKQIARLNNIAGTPETAFKFPSKYNKIELLLIQKLVHGPSIGLKKFWRNNLPTLKFHNDETEFCLTRIKTKNKADLEKCPTKILVHSQNNEVIEIDCANKTAYEILKNLVKRTGANSVPAKEIPIIKEPTQNM